MFNLKFSIKKDKAIEVEASVDSSIGQYEAAAKKAAEEAYESEIKKDIKKSLMDKYEIQDAGSYCMGHIAYRKENSLVDSIVNDIYNVLKLEEKK